MQPKEGQKKGKLYIGHVSVEVEQLFHKHSSLSIYKYIEMYHTTMTNLFDGTKLSPLDSLCDMYNKYVGNSTGIMIPGSLNQALVLGEVTSDHSNVVLEEKFLHFPTSRIYLMVNKANLKFFARITLRHRRVQSINHYQANSPFCL